MKSKYYLKDEEFIIENYNQAKPFSSFLPGIAGLCGKPLWAFYVNRGQCMASFGQTSKECAIMEFYPANTSYRRTPLEGFRTFVKIKGDGPIHIYEPFLCSAKLAQQKMFISMHELRIEEISKEHGLRFEVAYFTIPGENYPALARTLTIENISKKSVEVEVIDGMPKICPYGMNEFFMKHMSRTIEAWMEVACLDRRTPFYRLRVDAADTSETKYITSGNFYMSCLAGSPRPPEIIVDPRIVFGDYSDMTRPGGFASKNFSVPGKQIDRNITPSAFSHYSMRLFPGGSESILSLIGYASSEKELKGISGRMGRSFFKSKREENALETASKASSVAVWSGKAEFDMYARQTNLDNILRGGYPVSFKGDKNLIYVFNRKHGDLERDYNNFVLNPEFYSQGNGNFRDTNQNRRLSIWINPAVSVKDIKDFYNLIQLDGYNPLVVKGDRFSFKKKSDQSKMVRKYFSDKEHRCAEQFFSGSFTLGELVKFMRGRSEKDINAVLGEVVNKAYSRIDAEHGEGFWIDHWTYCLDLVESYLSVYPEKEQELLFSDSGYLFFDDAHRVKSRRERMVSGPDKKARQYHSVCLDEEKKRLIASRKTDRSWVRTEHGKGRVYSCTLAAKILTLIANKIATLDPAGKGIEMEADKPAWCDSLNGLPALIGSSSSETFELARLTGFLEGVFKASTDASVTIPSEVASFMCGLKSALAKDAASKSAYKYFIYWDKANTLKERYRDAVRLGIKGGQEKIGRDEALEFLGLCSKKLRDAARRSRDTSGVPYTYFVNDLACVKDGIASKFIASRPLPLFLEGPVHAMKLADSVAESRVLYEGVRSSPLYDKELGMYKLNAPLDREPLEIGRSRVFTPGWLENESVWLHMEYKFLLEVLKSGLYKEFFRDFNSCLIPFQPPARYGRSILENSSFIASSRFFDENLRGNGFVARLSGATAEFLHILLIMNIGVRPFSVTRRGEIIFSPRPVLEGRFFTDKPREIEFRFRSGEKRVSLESGSYAFSLFERTLVVYNNRNREDTFGDNSVKPSRYTIHYADGSRKKVDGPSLGEPYSRDLRAGAIDSVYITLG